MKVSVSRTSAVTAAVIFYFIAVNVHRLELLLLPVNLTLSRFQTALGDRVIHFAALFGFESFFFVLFALAWSPDPRQRMLGGRFAFLLTEGFWVQSVAKVYFARPRPSSPLLTSADGGSSARGEVFSFPSGHAFGATVGWLFFFSVVARHIPLARWGVARRWWPWCAACAILFVGFTRLYLAVHFLHDVVAGVALGLVWLHCWELVFPPPSSLSQYRRQLVGHLAVGFAFYWLNRWDWLAATLRQHAASGVNFAPFMVSGFALGLILAPPVLVVRRWSWRTFLGMAVCAMPMLAVLAVNKLKLGGGLHAMSPAGGLKELSAMASGVFVFALAPRLTAWIDSL